VPPSGEARGEARAEAIPAAPSTRRLARELGLDLRQVRGTGEHGRITEADLFAHVRRLLGAAAQPARGEARARPALPDFSRWGAIERTPLEPIRRRTAEVVSTAWSEIPHVAQQDRADVTVLEDLRKRLDQGGNGSAPPRITLTAILAQATASVLRRFPAFNASLDVERQELIHKRYVHIGVAVDTPRGLLVPVIRDADRKGLGALAREIAALAERAAAGKLASEELQGGSFTITNLGGLGTSSFAPIVRWPEVAILGVGRAETTAVYRESGGGGGFIPRKLLPLCLSYDHRAIDGADAARFLRTLAGLLENPLAISVEA
jgi:pyruvate dehydrogenase E2 component (dihydrolipoamide acetyltransferase)